MSMNCPLSGKPCNNPKLYHITNVQNGKAEQLHLCQQCADSYLHDEKLSIEPELEDQEMMHTLVDFLAYLTNPKEKLEKVKGKRSKTCPECGISIEEIARTGKMGCADCYSFFGKNLSTVLKQIHEGATEHVGKVPKRWAEERGVEKMTAELMAKKKKIFAGHWNNLQKELFAAVGDERYEQAVVLRDKIKDLETLNAEKEALEDKLAKAIKSEKFEEAHKFNVILTEILDKLIEKVSL